MENYIREKENNLRETVSEMQKEIDFADTCKEAIKGTLYKAYLNIILKWLESAYNKNDALVFALGEIAMFNEQIVGRKGR